MTKTADEYMNGASAVNEPKNGAPGSESEPKPVNPVFVPYSFDDLMNMPEKEWLIDQVVGAGDVGMIYGAPGCGKTFVGINMIVSACIGSSWAGRFEIQRPLNVAYCAGEGISGLPARFRAATEILNLEVGGKRSHVTRLPNFTFFKTMPQLYTDDDPLSVVSIRQFVTEWIARQVLGNAAPLDILFVDTMHTATTAADENSAKDMGKVLSLCRWAANELKCAVVLVHHSNKAGNAERGSSALRGAMDFMIEVKRISETGTKGMIHCAKLKDGEQWKDQTFDLHAVEDCGSVCVLWDEPNDGIAKGKEEEYRALMIAFMNQQPGVKMTAKTLSDVAGIEQRHAIRLLSKLVDEGKCARELMDTTKQSSNRNPLLYFIHS